MLFGAPRLYITRNNINDFWCPTTIYINNPLTLGLQTCQLLLSWCYWTHLPSDLVIVGSLPHLKELPKNVVWMLHTKFVLEKMLFHCNQLKLVHSDRSDTARSNKVDIVATMPLTKVGDIPSSFLGQRFWKGFFLSNIVIQFYSLVSDPI